MSVRKNIVVFSTALLFVIWYFPIAFPHGQPSLGHSTVPDSDADYLVSLRIFQKQGLYSSFSILYPPGRFLLQALLFQLFSPSAVVSSVFHIAMSLVFFPALLFVLSYFLFMAVFDKRLPPRLRFVLPLLSYINAVAIAFVNVLFIRTGQESHLVVALFFILLLISKNTYTLKNLIAGILLGLTFLFRLDAGIMLSISIVLALLPQLRNLLITCRKSISFFFLGICIVWLPVLIDTIIRGSLLRFLYDTLILGLIIQPKFMSLPIPENELRLVFISSLIMLTASSISLFVDANYLKNHQLAIKIFSVFSVLSYVAALGRSDEPHLWYGLAWLVPLVFYTLWRILLAMYKRESFVIPHFLMMCVIFFVFSFAMISIKSPTLFLVFTSLLFIIFQRKKVSVFSTLVAGTLSALLIFHSISYLKLKLFIPGPPTQSSFSMDWIIDGEDEIGGYAPASETKYVLDQIRLDIPSSEKYLFTFPKNVVWNEYLDLEYPTRYIILSQERSAWTEKEIIQQLVLTNTQYFLIFEKDAVLRKGPVWEWILANTTPIHSYQFGNDEAFLAKRRPQLVNKPIEYWLQF